MKPSRIASVLTLLAVASTIGFAACNGDDTTEPQANLLLGRWGGGPVELVAIHAGAEVTGDCATLVIGSPIVLRDDGSFRATGHFRDASLSGAGPAVTLEGQVDGSRVRISLPVFAQQGPVTFTLDSGVVPQRTNPECPL
jgi:hypothetical protein